MGPRRQWRFRGVAPVASADPGLPAPAAHPAAAGLQPAPCGDVGRRPRRLRPVPRLDRPSVRAAHRADTTRRTDRFRPMLLAGVDDSRRDRGPTGRTPARRAAPPRRSGGRRPPTTTPASTRDAAGGARARTRPRAARPVAAAMRRRRRRPLVRSPLRRTRPARPSGARGGRSGTEAAASRAEAAGRSGRLDPRPALTLAGNICCAPRPGRGRDGPDAQLHRRRG